MARNFEHLDMTVTNSDIEKLFSSQCSLLVSPADGTAAPMGSATPSNRLYPENHDIHMITAELDLEHAMTGRSFSKEHSFTRSFTRNSSTAPSSTILGESVLGTPQLSQLQLQPEQAPHNKSRSKSLQLPVLPAPSTSRALAAVALLGNAAQGTAALWFGLRDEAFALCVFGAYSGLLVLYSIIALWQMTPHLGQSARKVQLHSP
jgi:hypothetical protein